MKTIFSNNFLSGRAIEQVMRQFAQTFKPTQRILDIGCGTKPYQKFFNCKYIGLDSLTQAQPDIVGDAWNLPFPDNHFDGIILNQSLEHIAKLNETVNEIQRTLKPSGLAIITAPQTMKNHSSAFSSTKAPVHNFDTTQEPYWRVDYYRFTKFGLIYLFRDFKIISLTPTTGYSGSLCQLVVYFFASFPHDYLFSPLYGLLNILGWSLDSLVIFLRRLPLPGFDRFYHFAYSTLTINYIMVIQKHARPS
jgi:SAM-dependent methyltransferase